MEGKFIRCGPQGGGGKETGVFIVFVLFLGWGGEGASEWIGVERG